MHGPADDEIDLLLFDFAFCLTPALTRGVLQVITLPLHECKGNLILLEGVLMHRFLAIEALKDVTYELALSIVG